MVDWLSRGTESERIALPSSCICVLTVGAFASSASSRRVPNQCAERSGRQRVLSRHRRRPETPGSPPRRPSRHRRHLAKKRTEASPPLRLELPEGAPPPLQQARRSLELACLEIPQRHWTRDASCSLIVAVALWAACRTMSSACTCRSLPESRNRKALGLTRESELALTQK